MSLNVDSVTRRNLLKWGVVGLALGRNDSLQAYAQPSPGLAMQETAQSVRTAELKWTLSRSTVMKIRMALQRKQYKPFRARFLGVIVMY